MIIDRLHPKHLIASKGKLLYRVSDHTGPFTEVVLGLYRFNGILREETVDDFAEADDPTAPQEPEVNDDFNQEEFAEEIGEFGDDYNDNNDNTDIAEDEIS